MVLALISWRDVTHHLSDSPPPTPDPIAAGIMLSGSGIWQRYWPPPSMVLRAIGSTSNLGYE